MIEGVLKVAIFMVYLYLCSKMKEIHRVFQYHGAESHLSNPVSSSSGAEPSSDTSAECINARIPWTMEPRLRGHHPPAHRGGERVGGGMEGFERLQYPAVYDTLLGRESGDRQSEPAFTTSNAGCN